MNNVGGVIPANPPVIPAKAGIHLHNPWIPAFAGMTMRVAPNLSRIAHSVPRAKARGQNPLTLGQQTLAIHYLVHKID
jgi:hypothetical protein